MCKPLKEGGMSFKPLALMNKALLGKWLWRLGEEQGSLWALVVKAKHGVQRDRWDLPRKSNRYSCLWRDTAVIGDSFGAHISYRVASGEKISFWRDA